MWWHLPRLQTPAWKTVLWILVESCAYVDPIAYMYYAAAMRQAEERATEESDADEQQVLRPIERLQGQREALA